MIYHGYSITKEFADDWFQIRQEDGAHVATACSLQRAKIIVDHLISLRAELDRKWEALG